MADDDEAVGMRRALPTGALRVAMPFSVAAAEDAAFSRADLIFTGVRHDAASYEVRVFLNNPDATDRTRRNAANGYAGKFVVLGHGGCFGDEGHCRPAVQAAAPIPALAGLQRGDPMAGQEKFITVTEPLQRVVAREGRLEALTLVAIRNGPEASDDAMAGDVFDFGAVRLETYR